MSFRAAIWASDCALLLQYEVVILGGILKLKFMAIYLMTKFLYYW
jgi:hypothetical protein